MQNQVSELQGTIELKEGVISRDAQDIDHLNRRIEDILGDNSDLRENINLKEEQIRELMQITATLREQIEFASTHAGSGATTTIITGCPDDNGDHEDNSTTTIVEGEDPVDGNTTANIPNLRVDFHLLDQGFQIDGYTTTNPSYAEARLTQTEPFHLNLAMTEDSEGVWSAYLEEVNDRLSLDIVSLVVNPYRSTERWYERFGFGVIGAATTSYFLMGPAVSFELRRFDLTFGAAYSTDQEWAPMMGVTWRPFRRSRR